MNQPLLDKSGRPVPAAVFLLLHRAFRRDVARLARAVRAGSDGERLAGIRAQWELTSGVLAGHHGLEDSNLFPGLRARVPELGPAIDELARDHAALELLIERTNHAITGLPASADEAAAALDELSTLLAAHLDREEAHIVPHLGHGTLPPLQPSPEQAVIVGWVLDDVEESVVAALSADFTPDVREQIQTWRADYRASTSWM